MNNTYFIACPPLRMYPKPPSDQPGCLPIECKCGKMMWISAKKRKILMNCNPNDETIIFCYFCMETLAETDPEMFRGIVRHDI